MQLRDKTVLITGASSGIGRAIAIKLAQQNNQIIITARRSDLLQQVQQIIEADGGQCLAITADALDQNAASAIVKSAAARFGNIDAALLNIGDGPSMNMATISADEVKQNMRINYDTMVNYLIPLIEQMKSQKHGLIAQTNSLAGFVGLPMQGPYSAAKSAGRILFDSCRIELKPWNIKMVSLHPGFVATERVASDGIPAPFEITEQQAVNYIIRGMQKQKNDFLFPFTLRWLIRLARVLPKSLIGKITQSSVPENY
ncbi:SDR family NAD(P)-dependent oxidoreductase [Pelagibaculum spongiae]|uniref:Short-chain dehydrogenase n=1 Tax=Pelagibaculum spongiae TaxID=2080658 RepID=A0A2V1H1B8_9GAMM|nr:SDR family NAD(P)-dependent oxidoreductase [Pelagibaculum spongiae]PVZ72479.1 short-chain dehydrogenase [Pelagibaculum spongiae]